MFFVAKALSCAAEPLPDATEMVRQTVTRDDDLLEALRSFRYHRSREVHWLDNRDRVKSVDSTLHDVVNSDGAPYSRLLAQDGRRLDHDRSHLEEEKRRRWREN